MQELARCDAPPRSSKQFGPCEEILSRFHRQRGQRHRKVPATEAATRSLPILSLAPQNVVGYLEPAAGGADVR
jgi:hypothetical protein